MMSGPPMMPPPPTGGYTAPKAAKATRRGKPKGPGKKQTAKIKAMLKPPPAARK